MDEVAILDVGHVRALRLDLNALVLVEQLTGRNLLSPEGLHGLTVTDIRTLVWAAAVQVDPCVSLQAIGAELTPNRMPDLLRVLEGWGIGGGVPAPADEPDAEPAAVDDDAVAAAAETERVLRAMGARRRG